MKVDILGESYEVIKTKYGSEPAFKKHKINGYCDTLLKQIVCCEMSTHKGWEKESEKFCQLQEQLTLRHEIVHAFLYESGLGVNSLECKEGWATNEEMVDWIAIQGPKIYAAWLVAGAAQEVHK